MKGETRIFGAAEDRSNPYIAQMPKATKNQNPEQLARDRIDKRLAEAGWHVQDKDALDFAAAKMRRLLSSVALLLLAFATAHAQQLEVLATDPENPRVLATGEPLYIHIRYQSDAPVRFQVRGYRNGEQRQEHSRTNPAPPYPAGEGEALVWLEYTGFTELDELRVRAYDAGWKRLTEVSVPVDMEWSPGGSGFRRQKAAWVERLNLQQQQMTAAAAASSDSGDDIFWGALLTFAAWSVPGYLILQIFLLRRWRDGWKTAVRLPLFVTVPLLGYTLLALLMGSNLWPLMMLFILPFAFLYLLALLLAKRLFG